ncbi:MAG: 4Fe-4S dicluster domain-containing protein [Chloroflexi bacterium]|nr:4Fe-4S dicluster domain-containing protein [Chloroflexota bacterium]
MSNNPNLKQAIKDKARQLGFILAGVTSCDPPGHFDIFRGWLDSNHHGSMDYLASERSRQRRADPKQILPECKSILVLAAAVSLTPNPSPCGRGGYLPSPLGGRAGDEGSLLRPRRRLPRSYPAAPAANRPIHRRTSRASRPKPLLHRHRPHPRTRTRATRRSRLGRQKLHAYQPRAGSTFLLAEILLGIELEPDDPFPTDHCGTCTRCLDACPTHCILPDRTLDARRRISYLTIENKDAIPEDLREPTGNWVFGCDICQQVCPWNRFSPPADPALEPSIPLPIPTDDLLLLSSEFNQRFKHSPIKRAKRRGYLRNLAVAVGNTGSENDLPVLEQAAQDEEPLVRDHAKWAMDKLIRRSGLQPGKS